MGTYFSKENSVPANGSLESKEKVYSENLTINTSCISNKDAFRDHNYHFMPTSINEKVKSMNDFISESHIQPKVRTERLKYPSAAFNISSVKIEESRTRSNDYSDKVVNITKLLYQLLNARVVLEKLKEPPVKYPTVRAINVHTNNDLADEKDIACETASDEIFAQRFCTTCKKTKIARIKDPSAKNCPDCKIAMMYLCNKCNVKYYKRYPFLKFHLDRCNGEDYLKLDDRDKSDKNGSRFTIDKSLFLVKRFRDVNTSEMWKHYCQKCDLVSSSSGISQCCRCGENLIFMCTKCKAKYNSSPGVTYHLENHCYPNSHYQCTHCDFTATHWPNVQKHFKRMHTNQFLLKCEFCPFKSKYKHRMQAHLRKHAESDQKFNCNSCSYSTKFVRNLRRHEKLKH